MNLRTERYQHDKKEGTGRRIAILTVIFFVALGVTGGIALASYFSTAVYENHQEFKEYASEQMGSQQLFTKTGKVKKTYQYGEPISYAVDYDTVENENVAAFRDRKIRELEESFQQEKTEVETARTAELEADGKRYKPLKRALMISAAAYTSENGTISLAIYASDNEERGKKMVRTASAIETYHFQEDTGRPIIQNQTLKEHYRTICAQYFTEYFRRTYSEEARQENWESYLTADEGNFNQFVMTENNVVFYFDEGTVLKPGHGVVSAKIPNQVLGDGIREAVLDRYIDPNKPMVALTYDDGPGGDSETRILDCLENYSAVATFFYYGSRVAGNPGQLQRARQLGCEIGNHTWSHPNLTTLSPEQVQAEISNTNEAIKGACGAYPTVFRPSYGATNDAVNAITGLPVALWTIDTLDWKTRDPQKTFDAVAKNAQLDGKIVLLHSIHEPTATATELIVPWLVENGYQTVTVSELIRYRRGAEPQAGQLYR